MRTLTQQQPTDRPTDRQTNIVTYRVACYFGQKMAISDIFSGQDIMLGGQKILKNLGESISDTQINVSWSV